MGLIEEDKMARSYWERSMSSTTLISSFLDEGGSAFGKLLLARRRAKLD